eukprot:507591_1
MADLLTRNSPATNILSFQDCQLSSEIYTLYAKYNKLSESEKQIKRRLIRNVESIVDELQRKCRSNKIDYDIQSWKTFKYASNNFSRKWNVFIFGSEACDIRTQNSDIDIAIQLPIKTKKLNKINLLKELSKLFEQKKQTFSILDYYQTSKQFKNPSVKQLLQAEYPIIKIKTNAKNLFDISIADEFCLKRKEMMSSIIKYYEKLNVPIR